MNQLPDGLFHHSHPAFKHLTGEYPSNIASTAWIFSQRTRCQGADLRAQFGAFAESEPCGLSKMVDKTVSGNSIVPLNLWSIGDAAALLSTDCDKPRWQTRPRRLGGSDSVMELEGRCMCMLGEFRIPRMSFGL
jgi:hypothetical protein